MSSRLKTDSSTGALGMIQKAELTVVADVDHRLGLPGVEPALEKRAVERLEDTGDLEIISLAPAPP